MCLPELVEFVRAGQCVCVCVCASWGLYLHKNHPSQTDMQWYSDQIGLSLQWYLYVDVRRSDYLCFTQNVDLKKPTIYSVFPALHLF